MSKLRAAPTTKRIVYVDTDGTVNVVIPADSGRLPGESMADWLSRVAAASVPPGLTARVIDVSELPSRRFRNAWRQVANAVGVDLPLARAQLLKELRARRNAILAQSDGQKIKLDEIGTDEERQAYRTYRQALRDLPATVQAQVDAITTAQELESYEPQLPQEPQS